MDGFEWNKVFGAILGVAFVFLGLSFLGEALYHPKENDPSTVLDLPEAAITASGDSGPVGAEPILALLASADAAAGENVAKKCVACHVFEKGGQNKVGPVLYGVIGRPIASVGDFGYSGALKSYSEEHPAWTYEEMNGFLWKPKAHVKGTSMGFAGLRKPEERAAIIAWMNAQSDSPLPPPTAEAIAAEAPPAEGEPVPAAAAEGEGTITPAANKTGDAPGTGVINAAPDTPGATVAPAGANALGEGATTDAPVEKTDEPTGPAIVPSVAAPNTITDKTTSEGASVPLAPDADNPRAGAQSDSTGQQGIAPAVVEQQNGTTQPAAGTESPLTTTENPAPMPGTQDAVTPQPVEPPATAPTTTPAADGATAPQTNTTTENGTMTTTTVPIRPAEPTTGN